MPSLRTKIANKLKKRPTERPRPQLAPQVAARPEPQPEPNALRTMRNPPSSHFQAPASHQTSIRPPPTPTSRSNNYGTPIGAGRSSNQPAPSSSREQDEDPFLHWFTTPLGLICVSGAAIYIAIPLFDGFFNLMRVVFHRFFDIISEVGIYLYAVALIGIILLALLRYHEGQSQYQLDVRKVDTKHQLNLHELESKRQLEAYKVESKHQLEAYKVELDHRLEAYKYSARPPAQLMFPEQQRLGGSARPQRRAVGYT